MSTNTPQGWPTVRRHPRTMSEAFGPYHSGLTEPKPRTRLVDKVLYVVGLVALAVVLWLVRGGQ